MGKYIVIGASGDIGKQITWDLLNAGHEVIAHYYSANKSALQQEFLNQSVTFIQFDLSQPIECSPFEPWMTSHLNGLIYAAGTSYFAPLTDITQNAMEKQFNMHFSNLVKITQFVQGGLLQNAHGRIVVISSIWGETGSATESIYSGMKAAQIGFIQSIAKEFSMTSITANVVTPGIVNGKMTLQLNEDDIQQIVAQLPQQRLILPKEVSRAVLYLLDDLSQSVTGTVLRVNGGWYI
ncbi:elongation factor P 5-aminopentanone reductase [Macrococcus capreoli]|uniref:elongation factor P 5-aminopentanone reductase n=1 Tax=Macrococcus capreoli TaxID=2982690 RepID=UPI0021D5CF0C|nr:SDR family oxidoreductase [Macrococcus sp. TMW 2.2395]MCU7556507.1 SDR family oxidoreductase [Macrococcus sp. TMW 2.2395]